MGKIKNFTDFINESSLYDQRFNSILEKEVGEIPPGTTKTLYNPPAPSKAPETSSTSKIINSDKYEDYGTDPVEVAKDLEPLATGPYKWVSGSSGMPVDIYFKSESPLFKKPTDGSTYCTGFTFAVGFITALNLGLLDNFSDEDIKKMQKVWNQGDAKTYPKLCVDAIANTQYSGSKILGEEITLENAKPGDFCQIWRNNGYGHSVIFIEAIKKDGKITGIKYYSSNTKINPETGKSGPGENTEYFSDSGGKMLRKNTYFGRMSATVSYIEGIKDGILGINDR